MREMIAARTALWLGPGLALVAWAVDFAVMYAAATFWCERPVLGWIATLGCAALALAALLRSARSPRSTDDDPDTDRLGRDAAIVIALLALVAILWHGVAVLSLPGCPAIDATLSGPTGSPRRASLAI
jgi:hypothetical protein